MILLFAAAASGQVAEPQEVVLLPVLVLGNPVPGALGSLWRTELVIHNANDVQVIFGPCNVPSPQPCPPATFGVLPGETAYNPDVGFTTAGLRGRLIHIKRPLADKVTFNLRIGDRSAEAIDAGAEIPVVRGGEFFTGPLTLLNIPTDENSRAMLRIYDPDDRGPAGAVRIRMLRFDGTLVTEETVPFSFSGYGGHDGLPFAPSFIELPLAFVGIPPGERLWFEIAPATEGLRFWAFVSVTNNRTQRVTIISPH
ncbi:MAG TPA: hypothetical protein VF824_12340 [Thermoanaerobaculia bacterium]|jgi:hypothetical protein